MADRPVIVGRPSRDRTWSTLPCPVHPTTPKRRRLDDLLCPDCWKQLPEQTRRRLKLSGGSGRIQPIERIDQLRDQIKAGVPLNQIEVSP